jgi:hypothetical protein
MRELRFAVTQVLESPQKMDSRRALGVRGKQTVHRAERSYTTRRRIDAENISSIGRKNSQGRVRPIRSGGRSESVREDWPDTDARRGSAEFQTRDGMGERQGPYAKICREKSCFLLPMPSDLIAAFVLRRKQGMTGYAFLVLGYGNEVFQVALPSQQHDAANNGKPVSVPPFLTPGSPDPERVPLTGRGLLDLTDAMW